MKGRNNPRKTRKTKEAITRMTGNPGKAHFFYGRKIVFSTVGGTGWRYEDEI